MAFNDPSIHRVVQIKARTIAPDNKVFACLELTLIHQDGTSAEAEVYFNEPHEWLAFEYARAINSVVTTATEEDDAS